mmetsp:Transcript_71378/g.230882  ORF Transcript_71378/g.230882 Transcript_71378/m.230882 type:complete len:253 (+) Transcript_71378:1493-2251(+)
MGNFSRVIVVAANVAGEALVHSNVSIVDRTAESCPSNVGHHHTSASWRLVAGPVSSMWRVRAIRFYEDALCSIRLPTISVSWPRKPQQTAGEPFANPPDPRNLHEVFKVQSERYVWDNGTKLPNDAADAPWWSSGSPCDDLFNSTGTSVEFDPDVSACFLGFNWLSDSFIKDGRVIGSTGISLPTEQKVHCIEIEQSETSGEFSQYIGLQWYDAPRMNYKTLMQQRVSSGGFLEMAFQPVLAAECAEVNRSR